MQMDLSLIRCTMYERSATSSQSRMSFVQPCAVFNRVQLVYDPVHLTFAHYTILKAIAMKITPCILHYGLHGGMKCSLNVKCLRMR